MPTNTEKTRSTPDLNQKPNGIGNVQEMTTPPLNDALKPLPDNVSKKIKEVEEECKITLPKPWEYWIKETFNNEGYANNHYLSISCIKNIEIVKDDSKQETLKFYCDRVKTRVRKKEEKLSHHEDTRGLEEVIRWLRNWILKETTKEKFDSYVKQASNQEIEDN